ncbi:MAG: type I 3-dehydroquinate dehydratase [Proteobacteria bacterium]|nr:type I 3-dehydroquinate dehydratase [Pseudomonadota bacterium]
MLCVTGKEGSVELLQLRLDRVFATGRERGLAALGEATGAPPSLLQEVRLDALTPPLEGVWALLRRHAPRLLVCCRPAREGGSFIGSEADRLQLLERAAECGVAYLDLEADCSDGTLQALAQRSSRTRLVISAHHFAGLPADLERRFAALAERGVGDVLKLAVSVDDVMDLPRLAALAKRAQRPTLLLGMGPAGLLSRCRYPAFGAPWTYVSANDDGGTAPGQLTFDQALQLGLPQSATAPFLAVVGGPQVVNSPGPLAYNRLFRRRGWPWSYLPIITAQPQQAFALLRAQGAIGVAVTMPHKDAAMTFAGAGADLRAQQARAVNSLRFKGDAVEATNTDITGVREPLQALLARAPSPPGRPLALVLGAGGAGRAAALACRALGLEVTVSARREAQARALLEPGERFVAWDERASVAATVLINATPLTGSSASPWPATERIGARVVFDLALGTEPPALLQQARSAGAEVLAPQEMWLAQGAEQMSWFTGEAITVDELRDCSGHRRADATGRRDARRGGDDARR